MSNLKVENSFDSLVSATPSNAHNEWENDFIQSVETPYGASIYRERADMLIKEVKIMFREIGKGDGDLIDRLEMVDAIQCLGIYRYFENEIKEALDYVYRCWNGKVGIGSGSESISSDLYVTSLGFRALRLHRYHVSADVMENFKNKNDEFLCCNSTGEEYVMKSLLFLLRASGVSFPGETVMEEAKVFCTAYFNKILAKHGATHISGYPERLIKEVKYTLVYDWRRTFCRWEARNYIEIYGQDNARFLSRLNGEKLLELGKLEFNILQSVHQNEMKALSRWWIDSGVHKLIKIREHTIEYLLWGISTADEVEFSNSRIALAKITTLITIFDDLFDDYASIDQIKAIKEAVLQGWNVSLLQNIPNDFKESLLFVFKTIHELAITAAIRQGRDMMPHITKVWEDYITTNLQQAQWRVCGVVPNFKDYMKNASISVAFGPILLHSLISVAPVLTDEIIEKIYLSKSKFYDLIAFSSRLVDDTRDYEEEKLHGQTASAISSYMEDNPEFTEDEAINHINNLIDISLKELTWEFLNPRNELLYCEKICFNISRGTQFFYIFADGFTHSDKEIKDQIFKVLIEPVKIPIKIELLSSN